MAEFLPRLRQGVPIGAGPNGARIEASPNLILIWQQLVESLELIPGLEAAIAAANAAAAAAQTAADNANDAAAATTSESSLVNSFIPAASFTGDSPVSIDSTGVVTIQNHERQYGDTVLNPTVAVTGDTLATAAAVGETVRIFYPDPTRAGGAVVYDFTVDPADAPVQGGNIHVVGAATVPGAGSSDGGYVRPPGYTGPTP